MTTLLSPIFQLDLGDRKEIVMDLMNRLNAAAHKDFLQWCCRQLPPLYRGTMVRGEVVSAGECWLLLCALCSHHRLDFGTALIELQRRVRKATRPFEVNRRWLR